MNMLDSLKTKMVSMPDYNYHFEKDTGLFARWGKTQKDDPDCAPFPEILDLEISSGKCKGNCAFCYKDNGMHNETTENMTLATFKQLLTKFKHADFNFLTQIAFGLCDIDSNPDTLAIMKYTREQGIIPNFTCNGLGVTKQFAEKVNDICGAVAVSIVNKEQSYNAINHFTDAGMTQVNIHFMLSEETYQDAYDLIDDIKTDPRLSKLNAIVFLQYKHKNKKANFHSMLDKEKYKNLTNYALNEKVNFGLDSCSANLFLRAMEGHTLYKQFEVVSEPCESTLFSSYINCKGEFYPCSFCEGEGEWTTGINVLEADTFMEVWNDTKTEKFRKKLKDNCRNCPIYNI